MSATLLPHVVQRSACAKQTVSTRPVHMNAVHTTSITGGARISYGTWIMRRLDTAPPQPRQISSLRYVPWALKMLILPCATITDNACPVS
jgi:hypothetical protein